jgi:hypothetical protein
MKVLWNSNKHQYFPWICKDNALQSRSLVTGLKIQTNNSAFISSLTSKENHVRKVAGFAIHREEKSLRPQEGGMANSAMSKGELSY